MSRSKLMWCWGKTDWRGRFVSFDEATTDHCADESVPRAVASVVSPSCLLRETRSLPLAVLTRNEGGHYEKNTDTAIDNKLLARRRRSQLGRPGEETKTGWSEGSD